MGALTLSLDWRSSANRIFFLICLSLGLWISTVVVSGKSNDYSTAMIWRRIAVLGWVPIYSLFLHYVILLCYGRRREKKWGFILFLYLPVLLFIVVFAVLNESARNELPLIMTEYGWVYIHSASMWNSLFSIYYISFSAAIVGLLFFRRRKGENRRQILELAAAYIVSIVLGILGDVFSTEFFSLGIPNIDPLITLIPLVVILRGIRKHRLMGLSDESRKAESGFILSEYEQRRFYSYLGILFYVISFFHYAILVLSERNGYGDTLFSFILLFAATLLYFLPRITGNIALREKIMTPFVSVVVFLMVMYFFWEGYDWLLWPFPVLVMIIAVLSNKRNLLHAMTTVSVVGNIIIMFLSDGTLRFIPRIIFFIFSAAVASYVQLVYLKRLKDNEGQVELQSMISRISSRLVSINEENLEDRFENILQDLGIYFKADETYLITYSRDTRTISNVFHWGADELFASWDTLGDLTRSKSQWFLKRILENRIIVVDHIDEIPAGGEWVRDNFHSSVRSLVALPVFSKGRLLGVLGMNSAHPAAFSPAAETEQKFRIPSNLVADALMKVDSERKINYLAYYDPLTELPNRVLFFDRLEKAIALAQRKEKLVAVIMMDLDAFKNINDTMGHDAGDLLLRQVAKRLSGRIREYDTMSRFGGDEFLFVLSQLDSQGEVGTIADKLIESLAEPITIAGEVFHITGSAGISLYPRDGKNGEILMKNADLAMYESKKRGKNCFSYYEKEMKEGANEKMRLTNELYQALDRNEFVLHYQPQWEIDEARIIGMEALIRWNHPERGMISPALFIPLAEDTGLINEIGKWVLETACRDNKTLQEGGAPPIRVAVNLSAKQFTGGNLTGTVKDILRTTELAPEYLELEITEGIAMEDSFTIQETLRELSAMGIAISIDDFGTEYSSLSRLRQMPVDRIKIDKQFVQGISLSKNDESITSFIVDLSKSMNLKVIAEGVENDEQMSFLTEKACDEIQGFLLYKPMSFDNIEKIFRSSDSERVSMEASGSGLE